MVLARQERTSSKGNRFAYIRLTDTAGAYEVVAFSELLASARALLEPNARVLVTVEVRADREGVRLMAQKIEALDEAVKRIDTGIQVRIDDLACLETVRGQIASWQPGRGRVSLVIGIETAREVELVLPNGYAVPAEAPERLGALGGVSSVIEI